MITGRKKGLLIYGGIFGLALFARGIPLLTAELWRDEAVVGIMSLRVLAGEFPVFFFGQNFMGALEAYLSAVLILFLGPRAWVLELLPVILSLLFLFQVERLGRRLFPDAVVRCALLILAIPPFFLLKWSHEARSHYPLTLVLGTLAVYLAYGLVYRRPPKSQRFWRLGGLGLAAGLGWWTNHLIVIYLLPVFFLLWVNEKKIVFRWPAPLLLVSFFLGSLPLHLYHFRQQAPGLGIPGLLTLPDPGALLPDFFQNALPILLGVRPPLSSEPWKGPAYLFLLTLYGAALIYWLVRHRAGMADLLRLRKGRTDGTELLFLLVVAALAVNLFTVFSRRLSDNDQKYLLPVYTSLPLLLGFFLEGFRKRGRRLAALLLGLLVFLQVWGSYRQGGWGLFTPAERERVSRQARAEARLIGELSAEGFNRLYTDEALGLKLTFLSGERIIGTDAYQGIYLKYVDQVDGAAHPAYLFPAENPGFEANLQGLGIGYRERPLPSGARLFSDFRPPAESRELPDRRRWKASSNVEGGPPGEAFDGDIISRWQAAQQAGSFFLLDLGQTEWVNKLVFWPGDYQDVPSGYTLEASEDGRTWQAVARVDRYHGPFFWSGATPMIKIRRGRVEARFAPTRARYLKMVLTQDKPGKFWSINELRVYGPSAAGREPVADPLSRSRLIAFLLKEKIKFVYADHGPAAALRVGSNWQIHTPVSNHFLGNNGEDQPRPQIFVPLQLKFDTALLLGPESNEEVDRLLQGSGWSWSEQVYGPDRIYFRFYQPPRALIPREGWRASASSNGAEAARALDGRGQTRWTSGRPQTPDLSFDLDLGKTRNITDLVLDLGSSRLDYPRILRIEVSADGRTWQEVSARLISDLYWAGNRLFEMRVDRLVYRFDPAACRYLKLRQLGSDRTFFWSIHEINLYGPSPS